MTREHYLGTIIGDAVLGLDSVLCNNFFIFFILNFGQKIEERKKERQERACLMISNIEGEKMLRRRQKQN